MPPRNESTPKTLPPKPIILPTAATGQWVIIPDRWEGYERPSLSPPYLMVPVNGSRTLTIRAPGQGPVEVADVGDQGFLCDAQGRPSCRARMLNRMLVVEGLLPGRIAIGLRQGAAKLDILVSIKEAVKVPVIAHYVEQGPLTKTKMTAAMLRAMIAGANGILGPEANVTIALREERTLSHAAIGKALGLVVTEIPGDTNDEWSRVTKHAVRDPAAPRLLNLFLVRRFEVEDASTDDLAGTRGGCCLLEDQIKGGSLDSRAGTTLAHEVGHHLGLHDIKDSQFLMSFRRPHGNRLSRSEIDRINPSGVTINPFGPSACP
jgi:hypothetical protein